MNKTSGQKAYEQFCKEFNSTGSWNILTDQAKAKWERIAKHPTITADDEPNEPPGAGN